MNIFWIIIYNILLYPIFFLGGVISSVVNPKIRRGLRGRRHSYSTLLSFKNQVSQEEEIYWLHAASLGEYEQLKPVMEGLKEIEPTAVFIVSFFSPSGFEQVKDPQVDCKLYLPFDFPWSIYKMLSLIKPTKIIFAEYDVWPNVVWMAKLLNISTTVFSVHFSDHTPKLMPLVKSFYKSVYGSLTHIYAETQSDFEKVHYLISPSKYTTLKVLGNPRYDQVKKKTDRFTEKRTLSVLKRKKQIIVGSVWGEDEKIILEPLTQFLINHDSVSLLWVPHEPSENHIKRAFDHFHSSGLNPIIFKNKQSQIPDQERIIIIGVVGILSHLYWEGQVAYIGGGFSTGVHNVMEPAIARLPVLFGPKYENSHAAKELISNQGGFCISNSHEFKSKLDMILWDKNFFLRSSFSATDVIHNNLGSATRIVRGIIRD